VGKIFKKGGNAKPTEYFFGVWLEKCIKKMKTPPIQKSYALSGDTISILKKKRERGNAEFVAQLSKRRNVLFEKKGVLFGGGGG